MENAFNHTKHVALWNWLANHDEWPKSAWPGWKENGGQYLGSEINYCFACEYSAKLDKSGGCNNCPLVFPHDKKCGNDFSLYATYSNSVNRFERQMLATEIRDLPVRKGVKCI